MISLTEMLDQLRAICTAVPGFPVIGDGDTGFGNALNVRRTVAEYARAGAACIMLEDQVAPKRCGHFEGKLVISAGEARMKVRAAVEVARTEGILVLARTDARAVLGFEAALERCRAFEAEGADIVFMEAPETERELHDFAQAMKVPTMANMVAGGKTPILSRSALQSMGIKMAVYHPLLFSAVHAMNDALDALKADRMPTAAASFDDVKNLVGVPEYSELALRYGEYE